MAIDERLLYSCLGERLRELRERRGLSQAKLADRVGMLRTSVANIEAGRQRPPLHVLYALCGELRCDLAVLLPGIEHVRQSEEDVIVVDGEVHRATPKSAKLIRSAFGDVDGGAA